MGIISIIKKNYGLGGDATPSSICIEIKNIITSILTSSTCFVHPPWHIPPTQHMTSSPRADSIKCEHGCMMTMYGIIHLPIIKTLSFIPFHSLYDLLCTMYATKPLEMDLNYFNPSSLMFMESYLLTCASLEAKNPAYIHDNIKEMGHNWDLLGILFFSYLNRFICCLHSQSRVVSTWLNSIMWCKRNPLCNWNNYIMDDMKGKMKIRRQELVSLLPSNAQLEHKL